MVDNVTKSQIHKKLIQHDKRFDEADRRMDSIEVSLSHLSGDVFKIKMDLTQIKEDTAKIPRILQMLDKTATANALDRQERVFMKNRLDGHEERLVVVENTLSIKQPAEAF